MVAKCLRNDGEIFAKWWRSFLRNICEIFAKWWRDGGEVFAKCLVNVCEIFAGVVLACPRSRATSIPGPSR